ncbi:unnamed protein product [Chondrus crispus]|uniref:Uncharacterized protein n=1 Tax=Chondrus crispus TaxID=2769 RepID=R7QPK5_CHOCR|nr:unnamed protein product [Chondrus crispus]CDF39330.1 unnamed protein product [Chondrus crispus]|eukprot:XP_005719241.1 unnamed protein product [Chondrus crispus]
MHDAPFPSAHGRRIPRQPRANSWVMYPPAAGMDKVAPCNRESRPVAPLWAPDFLTTISFGGALLGRVPVEAAWYGGGGLRSAHVVPSELSAASSRFRFARVPATDVLRSFRPSYPFRNPCAPRRAASVGLRSFPLQNELSTVAIAVS